MKEVERKLALNEMGINPRNITYPARAPLYFQIPVAIVGGVVAVWWEMWHINNETHRMTRFRDKSALFGKPKGPDDTPSWGPSEPYPYRLTTIPRVGGSGEEK